MNMDETVYKTITGMTSSDMELDANTILDCMNCDTRIEGWILEDAGHFFYLRDYDCESCGEPLGQGSLP